MPFKMIRVLSCFDTVNIDDDEVARFILANSDYDENKIMEALMTSPDLIYDALMDIRDLDQEMFEAWVEDNADTEEGPEQIDYDMETDYL